jgi:hypothetical protein
MECAGLHGVGFLQQHYTQRDHHPGAAEVQGNLKRVWDPTSPADFAAIKNFVSGDAFSSGADLVVKAEYTDGSVQHALINRGVRGTDPLADNSFTYWAVNIPAPPDKTLTRVSLYYRPMDVRYSDGGGD